jgi:hypothetical protein
VTDFAIAISVLGGVISICATLMGAVWYLSSKITGLSSSADGLTRSVNSLEKSVIRLDDKMDDHADRITRMEERQGRGS